MGAGAIDHTKFAHDSTVDFFSDQSPCMSQIHYNATGITSSCDDYWLNKKRLNKGCVESLIFLSVAGLVHVVTSDVEK